MKHFLALVVFVIAASPMAQATGRYTCESVAADKWLTERQLTAKLAADGWKVKRMKKDGGCWEVYGNMPDGTFVEGYFHPASGEKLFISQRGKVLFKK
jgi:hypothetical protein